MPYQPPKPVTHLPAPACCKMSTLDHFTFVPEEVDCPRCLVILKARRAHPSQG